MRVKLVVAEFVEALGVGVDYSEKMMNESGKKTCYRDTSLVTVAHLSFSSNTGSGVHVKCLAARCD